MHKHIARKFRVKAPNSDHYVLTTIYTPNDSIHSILENKAIKTLVLVTIQGSKYKYRLPKPLANNQEG